MPSAWNDVEDRRPAFGEIDIAGVDVGLAGRREEVELGPDAAAGEAVDDVHAKELGGLARVDHLLGGTLAHALRIAVAPHVVGQNALVAGVDGIADALAHEVGADGPAVEAVLLQQIALLAHIAVALQRLVHLEMIAPTGQFQAVEAPFAGHLGQRLPAADPPIVR